MPMMPNRPTQLVFLYPFTQRLEFAALMVRAEVRLRPLGSLGVQHDKKGRRITVAHQ